MLVVIVLHFFERAADLDGVTQVELRIISVFQKQREFVEAVVMAENITVKRIMHKLAALRFTAAALDEGHGCGDVAECDARPMRRKDASALAFMVEVHNVDCFGGKLSDIQIDELRALHGARQIKTVMTVQLVEAGNEIRETLLTRVVILLRLVEKNVRSRRQEHSRVSLIRQSEIVAVYLVVGYSVVRSGTDGIVRKNEMVFRRGVLEAAGIERREELFTGAQVTACLSAFHMFERKACH